MIGFPHPSSMIRYANDRRDEMLAQAQHERLARLAPRPSVRPAWTGFGAAVAAMLVLALLIAASAFLLVPAAQPELLSLVRATDAPAAQVADAHLLDPVAADEVTAAWV